MLLVCDKQILPSYLLVSLLQAFIDPAIVQSMSPTDSTFLSSSQLTTSIHWPCYCTGQWMLVVNWLLDRKVESFGDMDSTIAGSMNACS
jgi:hypothetical protein